MPKFSSIAIYTSIFVLIVSVVAIGYRTPTQGGVGAASILTTEQQTSIDEVIAANLAANTAVAADLAVKAEILNRAASAELAQEYALVSDDTTTKPSIMEPTSDSRAITIHTVQSGETVSDLAKQYGIQAATIKWVNDLTTDNLKAGTELKILPVDGVLYTVAKGDTVDSIAEKYQVNKSRLVLYNDLEISGLSVGDEIILPNATLPEDERPGYVAPVTYIQNTSTSSSSFGYVSDDVTVVNPANYISVSVYTNRFNAGNKNTQGQCTWYAWERRAAIGRPLPSAILGNASNWAATLSSMGYTVNTVPAVGALIQNGGGYYGHVGVVEQVRADGSLLISDMNYGYRSYQVTLRVIPASATGYFNYIH